MDISHLQKLVVLAALLILDYSCKESKSIYGFQANCCKVKREIIAETHFIQLSCDKWDVQIDYGFGVYSPYISHSSEDYLKSEKWKMFAIPKLKIDNESEVDPFAIIDSILVLSIDDSFNAKLRYLDQVYDYRIFIPKKIANLIEVNVSDGYVSKKLVYDKTTMRTFQYYLINNSIMRDGFPESISVYLRSDKPMSLVEATKIFENIKFPD